MARPVTIGEFHRDWLRKDFEFAPLFANFTDSCRNRVTVANLAKIKLMLAGIQYLYFKYNFFGVLLLLLEYFILDLVVLLLKYKHFVLLPALPRSRFSESAQQP